MEQLLGWLSGAMGIVWAVIALGVLIFAHELGHFLVAKLSGVGVLKFSLGFGRKLVGWSYRGTEYLISALPLGGYVKMVGEEDGEELSAEDMARSFSSQTVWKRAAIVLAGPVFNILLAVLLCYVVMLTGDPTPIAKVADVLPGSPAASAGFMKGDVVRSAGDEQVVFWEQVRAYFAKHAGERAAFTVRRDGGERVLEVDVPADDPEHATGLMGTVVVAARKDGSPADEAGIQSGDKIVSVDGVVVGAWDDMADIVKSNPGRKMEFTYERDGRLTHTSVVPEAVEDPEHPGNYVGLIGVVRGFEEVSVRYGPVEAAGMALGRTYQLMDVIVEFLARLIGGEEKASSIGGPIAIVQLSERQASRGFADFVLFMAILSVNLGVINLIPIPILDGGHLFFLGLEAVMGRPLSMRKREIAQQIGLFIIIALMVFVFSVDILRTMGFLDMWR